MCERQAQETNQEAPRVWRQEAQGVPREARPALSLLVCPSSPGPPPLGARGVGMAEGWGTEQSARSRTWLPFSQVLGPELKDGGLCKESSFCTALGPGCGGGEYLEGLPGVTGGSALRAGADLHHLPRGAGHAPTFVRLGCGLLRHAADPGHRQCRE